MKGKGSRKLNAGKKSTLGQVITYLERLDKSVTGVRLDLDAATQINLTRFSDIDRSIAGLDNKVSGLGKDLSELREDFDSFTIITKKRFDGVDDQAKVLLNHIDNTRAEVKDIKPGLRFVVREVASLDRRVSKLES